MNRKDLFELVWSMPMTKVAQQMQISSSKLKTICFKLDIPLPDNRYWGLVRSGKKLRKPKYELIENETQYPSVEELCKERTRITDKPVICTSLTRGTERYFTSVKTAQRVMRCSYGGISNAIKHQTNFKGYSWRFAKEGERPKSVDVLRKELIEKFDKAVEEIRTAFIMAVSGMEQ